MNLLFLSFYRHYILDLFGSYFEQLNFASKCFLKLVKYLESFQLAKYSGSVRYFVSEFLSGK